MNKLFITLLLAIAAAPAFAQHRYNHGYYGHYRGYGNWVAPALIGGLITYGLTCNYYEPPIVVQQPPVIYQQPMPVESNRCSPWLETQQPDGSIVRTRTCAN